MTFGQAIGFRVWVKNNQQDASQLFAVKAAKRSGYYTKKSKLTDN